MARIKTAVVYCRTSTKGQKDAATIEAQIETCGRLVQGHGVQLLASYGSEGWIKDDGVSGSLLAGRKFAQFIDDLEAGRLRVDYLVTYSMSRLARHDKSSKDMKKLVKSATDKARIMAVLNGAGVKIIDVDGINDPASILTEIKETLSGEEYRGIRKRTMDGKARVLANGAWATGGRVPYGYRRVFVNGRDKKNGTTLAIDPVDGPRMLQLMDWYIEGGVSFAAKMAMEKKWPAPRGKTLKWYPSTVQQLRNRIHAQMGSQTLSIDGATHVVNYPALVDAALYSKVTKRQKETTIAERTEFLSTGYVDCACGRHIVTAKSRGNKVESGAYHVLCRDLCGRAREDKFARSMWEAVVARLIQIKESESGTSASGKSYGQALKAAKEKLDIVQNQVDSLLRLYLAKDVDQDAYSKESQRLRSEKSTAERAVTDVKEAIERSKRAEKTQDDVKGRVATMLRRIKGNVPLDGKRQIVGDLLQGERIVITWTKSKRAIESLALPAFGLLLPAVTVRLDRDVTTQLHEVSRAVLDIYYDVDDAVEDVTV